LYADLRGLPPIDVFIGTDDILLPDVRIFHDKVRAVGGPIQLYETPGGFHVFMGAIFTPESQQVYRQLARNLGVHRTVKRTPGPALWVAAALLLAAWSLCRQRGLRQ
jgi:acetyl esterase/lipase